MSALAKEANINIKERITCFNNQCCRRNRCLKEALHSVIRNRCLNEGRHSDIGNKCLKDELHSVIRNVT